MKVTTVSRVSMAALLMLLAWQGQASAATALFAPSKDNTLYESATGDLSNGAGDLLFAGRTNPTTDIIQRAVLAFDVAGQVPLGTVIRAPGGSSVPTVMPAWSGNGASRSVAPTISEDRDIAFMMGRFL